MTQIEHFDGRRIKLAATAAGILLGDVAVQLGISRATLSRRLASDSPRWRPPEVAMLCDLLQVDADFLRGDRAA